MVRWVRALSMSVVELMKRLKKDKYDKWQAELRWQEALRRLAATSRVTVDVETSGLDWKRNFICGYVLTFSPNPADSFYLPVRHHLGGNILDFQAPNDKEAWNTAGPVPLHPIEQELIKSLDRQGLEVWGFHLNFDLRFLWRVGMTKLAPRFYDGIINAPLLNEHQPRFSLEYCCEQAGVQAKKSSLIKDYLVSKFSEAAEKPAAAMGSFWRLRGDDPMAIEYAEGDGTSTWQLIEWQNKELEKQELGRVHDIESRLIPVLARMSARGVKIDEERLNFLIGDTERQVERLLGEFPDGFNPKSPNDVKKWCQDHGETDWPFTPGRVGKDGVRVPAPSFPEQWLKTHEAGQKVVAIRKLRTLHDTFLIPMRDTHLWNGRVHTTYHQLRGDEFGTVTGRLSSSEPNLQAVSKADEETGKLHRSIFIPDEGKIWASADYEQIEPKLLTWYSGCKVLLAGYNANPPVDAHTAVSAAMNHNWPNMSPEERKHYRNVIGKRINQTLISGGGKGVLVKKYGIPQSEVDEAWSSYFRAMPEIRLLQKKAAQTFSRRGYLLSLLGRRARLIDRSKDYTGINRLLQVGNADLIKWKLVQLGELLEQEKGVDLLNTIHDDIAFQFDPGARPLYNECLRVMTDFSEGSLIEIDGIPITVDAGEGKNWAAATYHD